ncbi:MAG: hypothetical protein ABW022_08505 [Actinoplanes sp.]
MEQKPSVGRIVHYVQYDGSKCCPAIVTEVEGEFTVGLHVFTTDRGSFGQDESPYSEDREHGTWHWPERV